MKIVVRLVTGLLMLAHLAGAQADEKYPVRPIKLVVGFAPGGSADTTARVVANHMAKSLGQPVVIENRPGAGGTLAAAAVAKAEPDGYTLLLAPDSVFGADKVLWRPNVDYDEGSFTPINRLVTTFMVLAVNKDSHVNKFSELATSIRNSKNGAFVAVSPGPYPSIAVSRFVELSGLKVTPVPFRGAPAQVAAVLANDVPMMIAGPAAIASLVNSGKLVALATTAAARSRVMPGVPTLDEEGLKGLRVDLWYGLAGPAGMRPEHVNALFGASTAALADPEVQASLLSAGNEPAAAESPEQFRRLAKQDGGALRRVIEKLGLKGS